MLHGNHPLPQKSVLPNQFEEHMKEEEEGPLVEFDNAASADEQAHSASAFAAFETERAGARGITIEDKDPDEYVAANAD